MVAVKVTACPKTDGSDDEFNVAEVVACIITWFTIEDVLPRLLASPTYTAVSG
jgi:hypothetical protein